MDGFLDLASIATQVAYFAFFLAALWAEYRIKTLAALHKACQRYWTAAALSALSLVIHLASVPYDGWWLVLTSAVTAACCIGCAVMADRTRDRRVIQELQRDLGGES